MKSKNTLMVIGGVCIIMSGLGHYNGNKRDDRQNEEKQLVKHKESTVKVIEQKEVSIEIPEKIRKEGEKYYYSSQECKQDYEKAFEYFDKAHKRGDQESTLVLAEMYCLGKGVEQNYAKAFALYRKLAEVGVKKACIEVAEMYCLGKGVEQNYEQACFWYSQEAKKGNGQACYRLGHIYHYAPRAFQNYKQAAYWYEKASIKGVEDAYMQLGHMYRMGKGVRKDREKAIEMYQKGKERYWYNELVKEKNRESSRR